MDAAATADEAVRKEKVNGWIKDVIGGNPLPQTAGDCEHVLLDPDVVDKIRMSVPSVKSSPARLWVNTFNVNLRKHAEPLFEHDRLLMVPSCFV